MTTEVDTTKSVCSLLHLAGSKLRNRLGGQLNESAASLGGGASAFAKAQLEKLGWKEGEGLGKRRQGMSSHIRVVKRAEGLGLGESTLDPAVQQAVHTVDWWKHSVGDTLAKLAASKKTKKKSKKSKDKKEKKRVYTDEELFEATGGARFGMRAQTQQHGKWKRAESNISEQDEADAKGKLEWDGMSAPVVVLKEKWASDASSNSKAKTTKEGSTTKKKRKAAEENVLDSAKEEDEDKTERKRQKKEKKKRRKEESSESEQSSKKSKKKSKKQKLSED